MPTPRASLITHPIRARILTVLMGRRLTIQQISELLGDVPLRSLYRHVQILFDEGILEAVDEVRVKGALTKVYAVGKGQSTLAVEDVSDASQAEHLRYLTTFLNTLGQTYRAYLEQNGDTGADSGSVPVHCLSEPLYLSPDDYRQFLKELSEFVKPWRERSSGEAQEGQQERRRVLFARVIVPDLTEPPAS